MTVAQAAKDLGLESEGSLRLQIRRGKLRAIKKGRDWFIDPDDLESYRNDYLGKRGKASPDYPGKHPAPRCRGEGDAQ